MKRLNVAVVAVFAALMLAGGAAAQMPDTLDRTFLTFSGAVELPGLRLEPGTYVFKLADTPSRNVVRVFTQDEMEILGQWMFVPAQRLEVSDETIVTFRETSAGSTPAIQYWFYPGRMIGKEFIYPKDQAMRIARRTGSAVLTEDGRITAEGAVATTGTVSGSGVPEDGPIADFEGSDPEAVSAQAAASEYSAGPSQSDVSADVRQESTIAQNVAQEPGVQEELPSTASPLALTGLLALLSLAGAAGVRALRR